MADQELLYINGVDAESGKLLLPVQSVAEWAAMIRDEQVDLQKMKDVSAVAQARIKKTLGLSDNIPPTDVTKAGWGVVFHKHEDESVKAAVMRLYEHRLKMIGNPSIVKVLEYDGEPNWLEWLAKYRITVGTIVPSRVPYYLLLVGGPQRIPFDFCQMLSLEYAVGLLHFDDTDAYKRYVESVIAYEQGDSPARTKEALFFRTNRDRATKLSSEHLVQPLAEGVPAQDGDPAQPAVAESNGFTTRRIWDADATAANLSRLLAPAVNTPAPAFLFTATHGVGFVQPKPDQQPVLQGALRCQDDRQFSAQLLADTPNVQMHGLIAFLFACYSAGTPQYDQYVTRSDRTPLQIAEQPFLAALPKAMLSHPQGGALACIGHIERAWNYSFHTAKVGEQLIPYQNAVGRILRGLPIGYALTDMRQRYASLAASVGKTLEEIRKFNRQVDDKKLVAEWAARNDAGGYVVIGDPAVKIVLERLTVTVESSRHSAAVTGNKTSANHVATPDAEAGQVIAPNDQVEESGSSRPHANIQTTTPSSDTSDTLLDKLELDLLNFRQKNDMRSAAPLLIKIGRVYLERGDAIGALKYYEEALPIFQDLEDRVGEATNLTAIGAIYQAGGEKRKAVQYYTQALPLFQRLKDKDNEALTLDNLGTLYLALGQPSKALEFFQQAVTLAQQEGRDSSAAWGLNKVGDAYAELGDNKIALECYQQALTLMQRLGDSNGEDKTYIKLGKAFVADGDKDSALRAFEQALRIQREQADTLGVAVTLNNLGAAYEIWGEKEKALDYFKQALLLHRQVGVQQGEIVALNSLGKLYASMGQKEMATNAYEQTIPLWQQLSDKAGEITALLNLGRMDEALKVAAGMVDSEAKAESLIGIADQLEEQSDADKANEVYMQALGIYRSMGDKAGIAKVLDRLPGVAEFPRSVVPGAVEVQPDTPTDTTDSALRPTAPETTTQTPKPTPQTEPNTTTKEATAQGATTGQAAYQPVEQQEPQTSGSTTPLALDVSSDKEPPLTGSGQTTIAIDNLNYNQYIFPLKEHYARPDQVVALRVGKDTVLLQFDAHDGSPKDYSGPNRLADPRYQQEVRKAFNDPQRYGNLLFDAIIHNDPGVGGQLGVTTEKGWELALQKSNHNLRVELILDKSSAESLSMHEYQWEYLRRPTETPIALLTRSPFYRRLAESGESLMLDDTEQKLKVLVAICNLSEQSKKMYGVIADLPTLDVALETKIAEIALQRLESATLIECNILPKNPDEIVTQEMLANALKQGYHVLHLVCHGIFESDSLTSQYALAIEGTGEQTPFVNANSFGDWMQTATTPPRLVVLAACQSAISSSGDALRGLGPQLVLKGQAPAVIAMQKKLPFPTAQLFMQSFYDDLARSGRVDMALAATRSTIKNKEGDECGTWAIPVLYMSAADGQMIKTDEDKASRLRQLVPDIRTYRQLGAQEDPQLSALNQVLNREAAAIGAQHLAGAFQRSARTALSDPSKPLVKQQQRDEISKKLDLNKRLDAKELRQFVEENTGKRRLEGGIVRYVGSLKLSTSVYQQIAATLNMGKHIILIGAPGTGKTTLAQTICKYAQHKQLCTGAVVATATADWSTFDTLGGYVPSAEQTLEFRAGSFLQAIAQGEWLVIDEINRAEIDKSFGELFTVLSGQRVDTPYMVSAHRVCVLPPQRFEKGNPDPLCWIPSAEITIGGYEYVVHPHWRIIGTMNVYDRSSLYSLSLAFMRRFAFIELDLPDDYATLCGEWINDDGRIGVEADRTILQTTLAALLDRSSTLMQRRALGPAIVRDMITYVGESYVQGEDVNRLLAQAFLLCAASQLDGLNPQTIHDIRAFLKSPQLFGEASAQSGILKRIADLYPFENFG